MFSSAYTQDPEEREMEIKRQDLKIETYEKSMHEHLQELKELMSARATPQQAMELIIMLWQGRKEIQSLHKSVRMS